MAKEKNWFECWFDSPYYHLLYKHRDEEEARFFLNNLVGFLQLSKQSRILDLACGRGRHSVLLNELGYEVTGLDLSPHNIEFANKFENDALRFFVHDMRKPFAIGEFNVVLNLFTSFGYFDSKEEDNKVIQSVYSMLKTDGIFVLDYLNVNKVEVSDCSYTTNVEGVDFNIEKSIDKNRIVKEIVVKDAGQEYTYSECVSVLHQRDFLTMFEAVGFREIYFYGDYQLNPYNDKMSNRLIMIGKK